MLVKDLIRRLKRYNPNTEVKVTSELSACVRPIRRVKSGNDFLTNSKIAVIIISLTNL